LHGLMASRIEMICRSSGGRPERRGDPGRGGGAPRAGGGRVFLVGGWVGVVAGGGGGRESWGALLGGPNPPTLAN